VALSQRADPLTRLVANRVALYRKRSGLNQEQLGQRMAKLGTGWSRSTVVKLENLNRESVSVSDLLALARALDVPPIWLLVDVEDGEPTPITRDLLADPWDALLWLGGRTSLDEEVGDWWSRVAPSIGRIYNIAGVVEQVRRNRMARTFLSASDALEEYADSDKEAAEKDRRLLLGLRTMIEEIERSGLVVPVMPVDVQDRAAEVGVELPKRGD
jgi:transcriptional regulator with XRE-family HTH domain